MLWKPVEANPVWMEGLVQKTDFPPRHPAEQAPGSDVIVLQDSTDITVNMIWILVDHNRA